MTRNVTQAARGIPDDDIIVMHSCPGLSMSQHEYPQHDCTPNVHVPFRFHRPSSYQLVFPAEQVDFDPLCLMQETPQLYMRRGSPSSFHFIHLTLQEYLAAVHISQLPSKEQAELIEQHLRHGYFKMVFRFLAGLTELESITKNIIQQLLLIRLYGSSDDELTLFRWLFGSHSDVTTVSVQMKWIFGLGVYVESLHHWVLCGSLPVQLAVSLIRSLTLRLSDTGICEEECMSLSELSKSSHHLKDLTVWANKLSSESVEMITRGIIVHSSSLKELNMSHSQFRSVKWRSCIYGTVTSAVREWLQQPFVKIQPFVISI